MTSRLNVLPFDDDAGKVALLEQILGRPLPPRVTIYPPFYTDHGLHLDLAERVFINQNCTFLDYAGIWLGEPGRRAEGHRSPAVVTTAHGRSPRCP